MRFHTTGRIEYTVTAPTRFFLNLHVLAAPGQRIERESLRLLPDDAQLLEQPSAAGAGRLVAISAATNLAVTYEADVACAHDLRPVADVADWPPAALDHARAAYLFPSRYCESDQLGRFAWQKFGGLASPYARAAAVRDWIRANIAYVSGSTHAGTSACAILVQRAGVCRDFAHLGVALCRALNLPARYATGYACDLQPPDMHAWFEVAIGPGWLAFDATGLAPLNGLVRVAHGRDAADTAIATAFGPALAGAFSFSCLPADPGAVLDPVTDEHHVLFSEIS
jgi:transglutaminase-like putative cysteine protease